MKFIVHTQFGTFPIQGANKEEAEKNFRREYNHFGGLTIESEENFVRNYKV